MEYEVPRKICDMITNREISKWENDLCLLLKRLIQESAEYTVEHDIEYDDKKRLAKEYAHRISLWMTYGYGTILSFDEFYERVETGSFIDYDGHGEFIDNETGEKVKTLRCNCDWLKTHKPEGSDYIMWFNK